MAESGMAMSETASWGESAGEMDQAGICQAFTTNPSSKVVVAAAPGTSARRKLFVLEPLGISWDQQDDQPTGTMQLEPEGVLPLLESGCASGSGCTSRNMSSVRAVASCPLPPYSPNTSQIPSLQVLGPLTPKHLCGFPPEAAADSGPNLTTASAAAPLHTRPRRPGQLETADTHTDGSAPDDDLPQARSNPDASPVGRSHRISMPAAKPRSHGKDRRSRVRPTRSEPYPANYASITPPLTPFAKPCNTITTGIPPSAFYPARITTTNTSLPPQPGPCPDTSSTTSVSQQPPSPLAALASPPLTMTPSPLAALSSLRLVVPSLTATSECAVEPSSCAAFEVFDVWCKGDEVLAEGQRTRALSRGEGLEASAGSGASEYLLERSHLLAATGSRQSANQLSGQEESGPFSGAVRGEGPGQGCPQPQQLQQPQLQPQYLHRQFNNHDPNGRQRQQQNHQQQPWGHPPPPPPQQQQQQQQQLLSSPQQPEQLQPSAWAASGMNEWRQVTAPRPYSRTSDYDELGPTQQQQQQQEQPRKDSLAQQYPRQEGYQQGNEQPQVCYQQQMGHRLPQSQYPEATDHRHLLEKLQGSCQDDALHGQHQQQRQDALRQGYPETLRQVLYPAVTQRPPQEASGPGFPWGRPRGGLQEMAPAACAEFLTTSIGPSRVSEVLSGDGLQAVPGSTYWSSAFAPAARAAVATSAAMQTNPATQYDVDMTWQPPYTGNC